MEELGEILSRSGGEKGLRGSGAGTLGVPLEGTRRVRVNTFVFLKEKPQKLMFSGEQLAIQKSCALNEI